MHGARQLAVFWATSRIPDGAALLDVGCGDRVVSDCVKRASSVYAVDRIETPGGRKPDLVRDLSVAPWPIKERTFDAVLSSYALQHFLAGESTAWGEIRRVLRPGGVLVCLGRYSLSAPAHERSRKDPLRSDNEATLLTLCAAAGMEVEEFRTFLYTPESFAEIQPSLANAFGVVARRWKDDHF